MRDALDAAKRLRLTAKSAKRSRRPTLDELGKLLSDFAQRHVARPRSCPMHRVIGFALFSTRRLDEITRLTWGGLDQTQGHARVFIKDMKHPGDKVGNDVWCDLPDQALQIALSMPRGQGDARVFPFNGATINTAFTRACHAAQIKDLRFHDLRHEGVSRLFETGLSIPQVAAVSGHRSWSSLQRYTHLRQTGAKYAGWEWIDRLSRAG
nr:tyrosine-type recombinase/integrase [Sagittula salina]